MKRFCLLLALVACEAPPFTDSCNEKVPDAVVESVDVFDLTGRVDFTQLAEILGVTLAWANGDHRAYDNLTLTFVPQMIPWNNWGEMTEVSGYYDPNYRYIEVAYTLDMRCLLDSALVHELLHRIEDQRGHLDEPFLYLEININEWLRANTEICR